MVVTGFVFSPRVFKPSSPTQVPRCRTSEPLVQLGYTQCPSAAQRARLRAIQDDRMGGVCQGAWL